MAIRMRRQRKTFCTECGKDLDNFWLSPGSTENYEAVLKHHLDCQREGRFKGTMCSKLYILDGGTPDPKRVTKALSPRKRAALKNSILKKIAAEEKKGRKQ